MRRRDFLKLIPVATIAALLPKSSPKPQPYVLDYGEQHNEQYDEPIVINIPRSTYYLKRGITLPYNTHLRGWDNVTFELVG